MTWGSKKYVKSIMENFKSTFGFEPSKQHSEMPPDYKPELYTTEIFTETKKEQ